MKNSVSAVIFAATAMLASAATLASPDVFMDNVKKARGANAPAQVSEAVYNAGMRKLPSYRVDNAVEKCADTDQVAQEN